MPRIELPPIGTVMSFRVWARTLTEILRLEVADVEAKAEGKTVTWRYGSRMATLHDEGDGCWWFRFSGVGDAPSPTMASMFDTRHDRFSAINFARTLAGYFDDRFCVPRP